MTQLREEECSIDIEIGVVGIFAHDLGNLLKSLCVLAAVEEMRDIDEVVLL